MITSQMHPHGVHSCTQCCPLVIRSIRIHVDAKFDQGLENVSRSMKESVYLVFQLMFPGNKATVCLLKGKCV